MAPVVIKKNWVLDLGNRPWERRAPVRQGRETDQLEKEGVIQRFEYCFELAWKTVKDYMEQSGFVFATVAPHQVLKEAFAAKIIADGQVWIDMPDHRNLLSHTYSQAGFEQAVEAIHARYLAGFDALHEFLQAESLK